MTSRMERSAVINLTREVIARNTCTILCHMSRAELFLAIFFVFQLQMTCDFQGRYSWLSYNFLDFLVIFKNSLLSKNRPEMDVTLAVLEVFSTIEYLFWKGTSRKLYGVVPYIEIQLFTEGFLKIINSMWCGSLQSELPSACILKHIKYYFHRFFVDWTSP